MDNRNLITAKDVAAVLNVSESRAYELARLGILPSIRLGRQVRFDPLAIESWVAAGGRALAGGWRREPRGEA